MGAISALTIERAAFQVLNVFQPGESIPNADAEDARGFINRLIGALSVQNLTIPAIAREVFPNVSGKGGPSNPYTIGIGGDLNTARPVSQSSVTGAGLILGGTSPLQELPRVILTDDGYRGIQQKELPNGLFTAVYYNPTYTAGFGTINLWPVPNVALNSLVLYLQKTLTAFADLVTTYLVPDAYEEMLVNQLVLRVAKPWGQVIDDDMRMAAKNSLSLVKRPNVKIADLANDYTQMDDRRFGYNIDTGNY